MAGLTEFTIARDFLVNANNYEQAKAGFDWPEMKIFNWALDYFDTLAGKCSNSALIYVDDKGSEKKVSFQAMKERSDRAANFLRNHGLKKRDRIMLMMSSSVELLEIFLGAMKAGCVIIPASTLLTGDDIQDRIGRGKAKCVFTDIELAGKIDSASIADSVSKVSVGGRPNGWVDYAEVDDQSANFRTEDTFRPEDELLIYFTSGTTAKPKLVLHTHGSYPVGHLTTMYWIGAKKGEVHYNISAPGWAEYCVQQHFRGLERRSHKFPLQLHWKIRPQTCAERD